MHEKGVVYIHDLTDENGNWLPFKDFIEKYNIRTNYLKYFGVMSAVRNAISKCPELRNINLCNRPSINFDTDLYMFDHVRGINISRAKSKDFYLQFISSKVEKPTSVVMWHDTYTISNDTVLGSMELTKKSTKEALLISFQFKVVHNIVNCASNLAKWSIKDSNLCKYCRNNNLDKVDTIVHALIDCPKTKEWLNCIYNAIHSTTLPNLNMEEILFGVEDRADNLLCIIIKKYICDIRGNDGNFCTEVLLRKVYMSIVSEKNSLKENRFGIKWIRYTE